MKIRQGFVTNSSSSSFIVINKDEIVKPNVTSIMFGTIGKTEFGWEVSDTFDFWSKLNFCIIQINDVRSKTVAAKWKHMLTEVLKEVFGNEVYIDFNYNVFNEDNGVFGYIDHASSACEDANTEMFDSKENLKYFLFDPYSKIHTDNDNY